MSRGAQRCVVSIRYTHTDTWKDVGRFMAFSYTRKENYTAGGKVIFLITCCCCCFFLNCWQYRETQTQTQHMILLKPDNLFFLLGDGN